MKELHYPVTCPMLCLDMLEKYEITVRYGSDLQHEMWGEMLRTLLKTLGSQMKTKHKKNSLRFSVSDSSSS